MALSTYNMGHWPSIGSSRCRITSSTGKNKRSRAAVPPNHNEGSSRTPSGYRWSHLGRDRTRPARHISRSVRPDEMRENFMRSCLWLQPCSSFNVLYLPNTLTSKSLDKKDLPTSLLCCTLMLFQIHDHLYNTVVLPGLTRWMLRRQNLDRNNNETMTTRVIS